MPSDLLYRNVFFLDIFHRDRYRQIGIYHNGATQRTVRVCVAVPTHAPVERSLCPRHCARLGGTVINDDLASAVVKWGTNPQGKSTPT